MANLSTVSTKKFVYMLTLLPKGVKRKLFWLKIFSICQRCQRHLRCTLSCEYLRKFSQKFETALMVYSGAWGKWFMKKTWSRKYCGTVPLKANSIPVSSDYDQSHTWTSQPITTLGAAELDQWHTWILTAETGKRSTPGTLAWFPLSTSIITLNEPNWISSFLEL